MSQQSLYRLDTDKYLEDFEDLLSYKFDCILMYEHFKVGNAITEEDFNEINHTILYHKILSTPNCDLLKYAKDKIEGKLENKKPRKKVKKRFSQIEEIETEQKVYWSGTSW